jgi:hypothetical protein
MSFHRENTIWQSSDGTWNRGFYWVSWVDSEGDPEWDVEYDYSRLEWVSTSHSTEEAAHASWDGANPGGYDMFVASDGPDSAAACERLDKMAAACTDNNEARRKARFDNDLRYNQFRRNW